MAKQTVTTQKKTTTRTRKTVIGGSTNAKNSGQTSTRCPTCGRIMGR